MTDEQVVDIGAMSLEQARATHNALRCCLNAALLWEERNVMLVQQVNAVLKLRIAQAERERVDA